MLRADGTAVMTKYDSLYDMLLFKHKESEKAVLMSDTGKVADAVWLPKSQIEFGEARAGGSIEVTLPAWLAKEKRLI